MIIRGQWSFKAILPSVDENGKKKRFFFPASFSELR